MSECYSTHFLNELVLGHFVSLQSNGPRRLRSILHIAALRGNMNIMRMLLETGHLHHLGSLCLLFLCWIEARDCAISCKPICGAETQKSFGIQGINPNVTNDQGLELTTGCRRPPVKGQVWEFWDFVLLHAAVGFNAVRLS